MKKDLIIHEAPKSPVSEAIRTLRTSITYKMTKTHDKVFLITSSSIEEGKSWVVSNLAIAFTQSKQKVLIIDTDMRKGRQYTLFNLRPRPGLSNYLSGVVDQDFKGNKDNIENYIQATYIDNLYLIAAGSVPPNPSELLVSSKMEKIKDKLIDKFDVIIFDAPPCLIVADALIISRLVDFNIIVSAQNITKKEDLIKARDTIEKVGGKVAGIVLNKVQMSAKSYENSYYYGERLTNFKPKRRK